MMLFHSLISRRTRHELPQLDPNEQKKPLHLQYHQHHNLHNIYHHYCHYHIHLHLW